MNWMLPVALVIAGLAVAGAIAIWLTNRGFEAHIKGLREALEADAGGTAPALPHLPDSVLRYAERAGGRVGSTGVIHATQDSTLATSRATPAIAVQAEQWTGLSTSGIVWRATGAMNGVPFTVLDAYVAGAGEFFVRLLGTFPVGGGVGPDYDKGELMRYLSELPLYPDAILNNGDLSWRQVDDVTVEVSATSRSGHAAVRFTFDAGGDFVAITADDRPMTAPDGSTKPTVWQGSYGQYRQFGRYRLPSYGEVGWVLPDGLFTYWHGTLTSYTPDR